MKAPAKAGSDTNGKMTKVAAGVGNAAIAEVRGTVHLLSVTETAGRIHGKMEEGALALAGVASAAAAAVAAAAAAVARARVKGRKACACALISSTISAAGAIGVLICMIRKNAEGFKRCSLRSLAS